MFVRWLYFYSKSIGQVTSYYTSGQ